MKYDLNKLTRQAIAVLMVRYMTAGDIANVNLCLKALEVAPVAQPAKAAS